MDRISVKEILEVHASVQALQRQLQIQRDAVRRKDRDIELLEWKLRGAEEMSLLSRFVEAASQTLLEYVLTISRSRIVVGNNFLSFVSMTSASSTDMLRSELKTLRDSLQQSEEENEALHAKCDDSDVALTKKNLEIAALKQRVSSLERDRATESLSGHYEDEIQMRETLIASLRSQNAQLMAVLRQQPSSSDANSAAASNSATSHRRSDVPSIDATLLYRRQQGTSAAKGAPDRQSGTPPQSASARPVSAKRGSFSVH